MCGIFGVAAPEGREPSITDRDAQRLRDLLAHRGPDGAGLVRRGGVVLAHRRLAVLDPTDAGAQPMSTEPDAALGGPRFTLVYNGELYNDADLRTRLEAEGVRFRTGCDTETLLRAIERWGVRAAVRALRGMFAFAVHDAARRTVTLARDPLGIKPLYWTRAGEELVFASEPAPIVEHPGVGARPDPVMVSAYLTTIRTVLGERTMFQGVRAVRPGEVIDVDLAGASARPTSSFVAPDASDGSGAPGDDAGAVEAVYESVAASVRLHLRSDVPVCALLSGGLDSTALVSVARGLHPGLRTYCAGCAERVEGEDDPDEGDLAAARIVAAELGTDHAEARIDRDAFASAWPAMVDRLGVPLSTPNEVAIHAVAERLRADGCVVTISGEGADELFGGYDGPLAGAAAFQREATARGLDAGGGLFEITANAWVAPTAKPGLLRPEAWDGAGRDAWLIDHAEREFASAAGEAGVEPVGPDGLAAHMAYHRRVNLTGLLGRLDTATMLASVEGRTPLADVAVASLATALPLRLKYAPPEPESPGGVAVATAARTKIALRRAFEGRAPRLAVERPKRSFPLPFRAWLGDHAGAIRGSEFLRGLLAPGAIEGAASDPRAHWNLAWPAANLALWARRWWGA